MDEFSVLSQKRFAAAQEAGRFAAEITAVEIAGRKDEVTRFEKDERPS